MEEDHPVLCRARQELAAALQALLKAEIMGTADFAAAKAHHRAAGEALNTLLRWSRADAA